MNPLPSTIGTIQCSDGLYLDVYQMVLKVRDMEYGCCHLRYIHLEKSGLIDALMKRFPPGASREQSADMAERVRLMRKEAVK